MLCPVEPEWRRVRAGPGGYLEPSQAKVGISLLFAAGTRPAVDDVARLLDARGVAGRAAQISYRPPDDPSWLELLASGLTYDLHGLAPAGAAQRPAPAAQLYGLPAELEKFDFEAVSLTPGGHIAAGGGLLPIVRVLLGLATALVQELPVTAVCWNPAQSWMEPKYFGRVVQTWLAGGVFPALGLTCLLWRGDGLESTGLAYFTGQELCVPRPADEPGSDTMRIAARAIDHLVRRGPLDRAETLYETLGERMTLEPSADGRRVMVTRSQ